MGTTFPDQGRAATPTSALLSLPPHFEFQGHSCRPLRPTGQDTAVKGRYLHPSSSPSVSHAFQGRSFKAHWSRQGGQGSISLLTREPISKGAFEAGSLRPSGQDTQVKGRSAPPSSLASRWFLALLDASCCLSMRCFPMQQATKPVDPLKRCLQPLPPLPIFGYSFIRKRSKLQHYWMMGVHQETRHKLTTLIGWFPM